MQEHEVPHLSAKVLAARWTTTTGRLGNMRCDGRGPAYVKIGSRVLYRLSDVEAYEAAHRVTTLDAA